MVSLPSLYNTLTRKSEPLVPIKPEEVGIYCCGPTVYDVPHIGHARAALAPDLIVRRLRALGQKVRYVRNITDVDDKILERSKKNGESPPELAERMAKVYRDQMRTIGCLAPDHEPKVSEHLPEVIAIVEKLIARGAAYVAEMPEGTRDVYFRVRSFPGYGKLSRRRIDELVVGARVEAAKEKEDPLDFALWKGAPAEEWGWSSPWGHGRPGWHIECSAMCTRYLGQPFDVHAGGMDLIFPHHENEIAQSEAAEPDKTPLAKVWVHNGFLNVDKEKMSKSLGNFVTVSDALARNDPEAIRYFLLGVHYRGPIQFDTQSLPDGRVVFPGIDEAERRTDYLFTLVERLASLRQSGVTAPAKLPPELAKMRDHATEALRAAEAALDDDVNTPVALASLGELARLGHELADLTQRRRKDAIFTAAAGIVAEALSRHVERLAEQLGLLRATPVEYRARTRARRLALRGLDEREVDAKVNERTAARKTKDFARADELRAELSALGIAVNDGPDGSEWSVDP